MTHIGKLKAQQILDVIKDVRGVATMDFTSLRDPSIENPFDPRHMEFTNIVKKSSALWRQSWIIGPLDEVIEILEKEIAE